MSSGQDEPADMEDRDGQATQQPEKAKLKPSFDVAPHPEVRIPEYDSAIAGRSVSFTQLVDAAYRRLGFSDEGGDVNTKPYELYYPKLLDTFSSQHGRIVRSYFASHNRAVAILTEDKELFVEYPMMMLEDVEFLQLLSDLMLLHVRARQFLNSSDYKDCMDPVFEAITYCLSSSDAERLASARSSEHKTRLTTMLTRACTRAETDLWQMVQRRALVQYFAGMLAGVIACILAAVALSLLSYPLLPLPSNLTPETSQEVSFLGSNYLLQVAAIAGAIGAAISVLQRISAGKFSLSQNIVVLQQARRAKKNLRRPGMLWTLGAFRPVIGAVFGIAFYVFQSAGLIPFVPPPDVSLPVYFAALAFVAGFSERFARDMVLAVQPATGDSALARDHLVGKE